MGELIQKMIEVSSSDISQSETASSLPFPFKQQTFCRYEAVEKRIDKARVLVVDSLLRDERDVSSVARSEWGDSLPGELKRERLIASMALENILNNVSRLVKNPATEVVHLSEVEDATRQFQPDLDKHEQHEQRENRPLEYQYRFIRITDPTDPIFQGIHEVDSGLSPDYAKGARILRVWQNHGLQLDRVPAGFKLLATSYLCSNQMTVKRSGNQLIYTVQFHLEKSFEDWNKSRTRWEHPNESRDGRLLFENFLSLALRN